MFLVVSLCPQVEMVSLAGQVSSGGQQGNDVTGVNSPTPSPTKPGSIHSCICSFIQSKTKPLSSACYELITTLPPSMSETHRMETKNLKQDHPT